MRILRDRLLNGIARRQLPISWRLAEAQRAVTARLPPQPSSRRPRLLMLADKRGWAFDTLAQQRRKHMAGSWDVDILYVCENPVIDPTQYDLMFNANWNYGSYDLLFENRYIRGLSSHKWQTTARPWRTLRSSLRGAIACFTPDRASLESVRSVFPAVFLTKHGVDPEIFFWMGDRTESDLVVGWTGNPSNSVKRLDNVIRPACAEAGVRLCVAQAPTREDLNRFYNGVDLVLIASQHEGDPLSLFEAGACGRAVLATRVGCVPEMVEEGVSGLVVESTFDVERTVRAFVERLHWCKDHVVEVRAMGKRHRERVLAERTPEKTCETFRQGVEWAYAHCARRNT